MLLAVGQSDQRIGDEEVVATLDPFPDAQGARREVYALLVVADLEHVDGLVVEIGGDIGIRDAEATLVDGQGPLLQPPRRREVALAAK